MQAIIVSGNKPLLIEREIPAVATGSVRIGVVLAGLCRTDMYVAKGQLSAPDGTVLGHEFCGVIDAVGADVTHLQPGMRVAVMPVYQEGDRFIALGKDVDGAFAQMICVPAALVHPVPSSLSDKQAAYLEPVAASLAVLRAPIAPQMRGAIYGNNRIAELTRRILSAKGFHQLQLVADHNDAKLAAYDFVIETTPTADAFAHMADMLCPGGLLVLKSRPYNTVALPVTRIVQKELRVFGAHYGSFAEAIALLESGAVNVDDLLGDVYPLADAVSILAGDKVVSEDKKIFFKP